MKSDYVQYIVKIIPEVFKLCDNNKVTWKTYLGTRKRLLLISKCYTFISDIIKYNINLLRKWGGGSVSGFGSKKAVDNNDIYFNMLIKDYIRKLEVLPYSPV